MRAEPILASLEYSHACIRRRAPAKGYNDLSGEEPAPDLPLHGRWVFWQQLMSSGGKSLPYSQSTRQIAECETVQEFWQARTSGAVMISVV